MEATITAAATALGGESAVIRLSGPAAFAIAERAGLTVPPPWRVVAAEWPLAAGRCPCRLLFARAPRSFTGWDVLEITLPGSRDLVELALAALLAGGAERAEPGGFARQALANGRLSLIAAEAILALSQAPSAAAAAQALARLRSSLAQELAEVRQRLLALRAEVEAGLDFLDEGDVRAYDPGQLQRELAALQAILQRWIIAADELEAEPRVCLVGPANAGKSALFNRLTGAGAPPALVSAVAGTTRDWLEARWLLGERSVRLVDTAGWLEHGVEHGALDRNAVRAGEAASAGAALLLACSAADARLADAHGLPAERTLVIATKCDFGETDPRAVLAVSAASGVGCVQLAGLVAARLGAVGGGEPRQQRLLAAATGTLARLVSSLPADELLAEDLRTTADQLGELLGASTSDEVLDAIFARFCIGK